ncbi:non-ribosomal peptide synthetase [Plantactinospora endophytica]|uniref:Carrier domain-containing protein n=1 Tax=Plantactinospora endophytica TaxID=673535 RepID=A0ABQ4EEI8_9ACTN|nr:non-ribosomal peptide synthetase [Plantactinospora endophytica]GIG93138.1 hypothetical protein Pen02_80740 [Plantactinospora endophytica]
MMTPAVPPGGLFALFAAQMRSTPDQPAVRCGADRLTYRQLYGIALGVAEDLCAAGVTPGDVVGLHAEPSVPYVAGVLGVLAAGAAFLPLDPAQPVARVRQLVDEARPAACLATAGGALPDLPVKLLRIPASPPAVAPVSAPLGVAPDDLAYVIYTSGSTGRPKGVRCHHRGIVALLADVGTRAPLPPGGVCTWWTATGFDVSVYEIFSALLGGELLVVPAAARTDPAALLELFATERVASAYVPPFAVADLADWAEANPGRLVLRRLLVGVEPIEERLLRRIAAAVDGLRVLNGYGPTETHVCATLYEVPVGQGDSATGRTPIGRPVIGSRTYVLDDAQRTVAPGTTGELYVGGAGIAHGYHRAAELTAVAFPTVDLGAGPQRLYRTGDLVRQRADGELMFVGRADHQLKVRGHRVEPGEVEAALLADETVRSAAVTSPAGSDVLRAYVVPQAPDGFDPAGLRSRLASRLPSHLVPDVLTVLHRLPQTRHGKLDRAALADLAVPAAPAPPPAPYVTATERYVGGVWADILGGGGYGPRSRFLDAGGHSLAAIRIAGQIRRDTGVDVTIGDVYAHPTVAGLAALVERHGTTRRPANTPVTTAPRLAPLSAAQDALLLLHRMYPDCRAYHVAVLHEVTGALDVTVLRDAVIAVCDRHTALGSTLVEAAGTVLQKAGRADAVPFDVVDAQGGPTALARQVAGIVQEPWNLRATPALRVTLLRTALDRHLLLLLAHHLFTDGWSMELVQRDLSAAYRSLRAGRTPDLPPVRQAAELAKAGRHPDEETHVAYWRQRLARVPPPQPLPIQRARGNPRFRGDRVGFTLDGDATTALRTLARDRGVGLFSVLATGFATVLTTYLGRPDVLLGVPVAGRDEPDWDDSVGFFNNSLAVPCTIPAAGTFAANATAFQTELLAALSHRQAPFAAVVNAVAPPREAGANPLFRFWCNMLSYPKYPLELDGCAVRPVPAPVPGALFDLSCYLVEHPDRIDVELVFDTDLFDRDRIEVLAAHCRQVYKAAAEAPDEPVGLAAHPPRPPLPAVGRPAVPTVAEQLTRATRACPDLPALVYGDRVWTYRELHDEVAARPPHGFGYPADRDPALVLTVLAALTAGVPFALLDRAQPADRLRRMRRRLEIDAATLPNTTAYVAFTSGTSGEPQGVIAGQAPLAAFVARHRAEHGIGPGDRFALLAGIGHDPLLREILVALTSGATLYVPEPGTTVDPGRLVRWLAARRITVLYPTPATGRLYAGAAQTARLSLPDVRLVGFGGAPSTAADVPVVRRLFPRARLQSYYGATETPQVVSVVELVPADPADLGGHGPADGRDERGPLGTLLGTGHGDADLLVVDRDGRPAPVNALGEVVVRSPHLALGYLGAGPATQRFRRDPGDDPAVRRYHTGDLGCRRPDGRIEFRGRTDRQLNLAGLRAEPGEIEHLARTHPEVRECLVIGPGEHSAEALTAYIQPATPTLTEAAVRAHLAAVLPPLLVPADVILVDAIPLTANGKLDPRRLPPRRRTRTVHTDLAGPVAAIWAAALGEQPAPDVNFFDAGGTSVTLLLVQDHLKRLLGRTVPLALLFAHPTVRSMAAALTADP